MSKEPGRCGGDACVRETRIPVGGLVQARRLRATEADLLRTHPSLTAADLQAAWEYAAGHPDEIDRAIRDNEAGGERVVG